jgi:hypothetical protein
MLVGLVTISDFTHSFGRHRPTHTIITARSSFAVSPRLLLKQEAKAWSTTKMQDSAYLFIFRVFSKINI